MTSKCFGMFVRWLLLAILLIDNFTTATAQDKESTNSFQLTTASQLDMETHGQKKKFITDTDVRYSWHRKDMSRTLSFESMNCKIKIDEKETMSYLMSRAKFVMNRDDQKNEVLFENAPEALQKMLQDSFGTPVLQVQVDLNAKAIKKELIAGPGAKALVDEGVITNGLLFHPPFQQGKELWDAEMEVTMGNGRYAKGMLTYTKIKSNPKAVSVKVSGNLKNEGSKLPGVERGLMTAQYVISGEQLYDPVLQEWVSGTMKIDVSLTLQDDGKTVSTGKGNMKLSFRKLDSKE